jgi:predicted nuclease of restriction endonuclease-like (RecB) superfamily
VGGRLSAGIRFVTLGKNVMNARASTALVRRSPAKPGKPSARSLLADVRGLILQARAGVARAANSGLTLLYWQIGDRIRRDVLREKRGEYGKEIVVSLSRQLEREYGRGYAEKNLRRMVQFAEVFPDREIVVSLIRQLTWTHFIALIPLDKPLQREFYAEMCRVERWSVSTLRKKIGGMLYERTALSRKPAELAALELKQLREEDKLTPDLIFRDPYLLDFLGLKDSYVEKDLEAAILREMESFILELGVGFAFLERQKRITVDGEDYYLDLLFYHRHLRRLVAIDLKLEEFKPGDKGQMELYLKWLDRFERQEGEDKPIGLILCAGKRQETVELLDMAQSGIRVSAYWTEALPKKELERKLHDAVRLARARLAAGKD